MEFCNSSGHSIGRVFSNFIFIVFFILVCGSYVTYNSPVYEGYYKNGDAADFEWLYGWLSTTGYVYHIDYKYFVFVLFGIGLLMLRKTASKYLSGNDFLLFLLLFIYPLSEIRSAFRNSLAMFVVIYAFPLITTYKVKDLIKFYALLFIATGFHKTSYLYFILGLIPLYQSLGVHLRKTVKYIYVALIVLSVIICFSSSIINSLQPILISFTTEYDLARNDSQASYFENIADYGFIMYGLYQLSWVLILTYLKNKYLFSYRQSSAYRFLETLIIADVLLLVMVIGYKFNGNFFRIFMNLVPLNYIALILSCKLSNVSMFNYKFLFWACLTVIILFGISQTIIFFDYNILTMFTENWLLRLNL